MAFDFKVYESPVIENLGTLVSIAGIGGTLRFTNKSLNSNGQLAIVIKLKDGKSDTVTCSKVVTTSLRKAMAAGVTNKQCLASIKDLDVIEAPNGGNYVSAPRGEGGIEEFTITDLRKEKPITWGELVAF